MELPIHDVCDHIFLQCENGFFCCRCCNCERDDKYSIWWCGIQTNNFIIKSKNNNSSFGRKTRHFLRKQPATTKYRQNANNVKVCMHSQQQQWNGDAIQRWQHITQNTIQNNKQVYRALRTHERTQSFTIALQKREVEHFHLRENKYKQYEATPRASERVSV